MATKYTFGALAPEYTRRWAALQLDDERIADIDASARRVLRGKARYQAASAKSGVPWFVIGAWHDRESSCDFDGILHNGEAIIGTGRKTRLVPKGRGPFSSWEEAAADALGIKGLKPGAQTWTVEMFLFQSERYNGFGYRGYGKPSAYLWSGTNQYKGGKYVRDGVFDGSEWDEQVGVVATVRRLMDLDASVRFAGAEAAAPDAGTINVDDGLSDGEVLALQQRLRDLGYSEVGRPDGKWGPRTSAAVSAFQATVSLPVTGELDKTTAAALATSGPRPVSDARAKTTASDLRKAGDGVAKSAWWTKLWSAIFGVPTFALGVAQQTGTASGYISTAKSILANVPDEVWFVAVFGVAAAIYLTASRTESAAVANVRDGRDAGPA